MIQEQQLFILAFELVPPGAIDKVPFTVTEKRLTSI